MIEGARAEMLAHPTVLGLAIGSLFRGGTDIQDEAAAGIIGETVLMWRKVLEQKFKK